MDRYASDEISMLLAFGEAMLTADGHWYRLGTSASLPEYQLRAWLAQSTKRPGAHFSMSQNTMLGITNKLASICTYLAGKCFPCLRYPDMAEHPPNAASFPPLLTLLGKHPETQRFSALISLLPDVQESLGHPDVKWTIWAPNDEAMRKVEEEMHQMPIDEVKRIISCLISPYCFPSRTLYNFPNVPLLHEPINLNGRQLLRVRPTFLHDIGPTFVLNFGSHVTHSDIFASNGVIHIIDSLPCEPVPVTELLESLPPASFDLLQQAIRWTGFQYEIAEHVTQGCTFFAPTNAAFAERDITTFEHLLAMQNAGDLLDLLRGHCCPDQTLYSNMLYKGPRRMKGQFDSLSVMPMKFPVPTGQRTFRLRTMLKGANLSVSINRYAGAIHMAVNGKAAVISSDHLATNGVVHIVDRLVVQVDHGPSCGDVVINLKAN